MKTCSICGKSPVVGWGFCKKHYRAYDKYGDPTYSTNLRGVPLEERVQVDEITGCLLWVGSTNTSGYGIINVDGEGVAHRASYKKYVGPILPGMHILHTCDRPACVAPEHLFQGTHLQNMQDMKAKGRSRGAVGAANAGAKITESQAIEIMRDTRTQNIVAEHYGISSVMVGLIRNGRAWKHIFKEQYRDQRTALTPSFFSNGVIGLIKKDTRTQMQIAVEYGVSQSTISKIKRGVYDKIK